MIYVLEPVTTIPLTVIAILLFHGGKIDLWLNENVQS